MQFKNLTIPSDLARFLERFVTKFPEVEEIWVFGSQASGLASPASDWDLLIRSGDRLKAEHVASAVDFDCERFPLYIATDDDLIRPWPRQRDGRPERLTCSDIRWQWCGGPGSILGERG